MVRKIIKRIHDSTPDFNPHRISEISKKSLSRLEKIQTVLFEKPLFKVPLFLGGAFILTLISIFVFQPDSFMLHFIEFTIILLTTAYLVLFMVYMIKRSFKSLLTARNMWALFFSYAIFMLGVILFFASAYSMSESIGEGYLKYGTCSSEFDESMINSDNQRSSEFFYFSATTLFTVGYGDICPMGWNKYIAVINAFIGNFINVVLMVTVIANYLNRKNVSKSS